MVAAVFVGIGLSFCAHTSVPTVTGGTSAITGHLPKSFNHGDRPAEPTGGTNNMKFRKKPVVIEAITFDEFVQHGRDSGAAIVNGMPWSFTYNGHAVTHENDTCYLIPTLEGTHNFTPEDMLITGVKGEIYPCKKDIFAATYEAVAPVTMKASGTGCSTATFCVQEIVADKSLRQDTDAIIQRVKDLPTSRERSLAITKLQEAVMWLGMDLKRLGTPNPYPNSKDPSNTIVEPTADGLKL